jgi:type III secretion protein V
MLHLEMVEYDLARLHGVFPDLVIATMSKITLPQLTRILRDLLSEELSIRDLRSILERVLSYDYVVTEPGKYIVFDDRLPLSEQPPEWPEGSLSQHVRNGLKRYITHKFTRGQSTLIVYLLDPEIEKQILAHVSYERGSKRGRALTPEMLDNIRAAVRAEIRSTRVTSIPPVILTISEIRSCMRQLIASEFPNLFVVSYEELSTDSNIQPIARISL